MFLNMNKYLKKFMVPVLTGMVTMYSPCEYINCIDTKEAFALTKPYLKSIYVDKGYEINFSPFTYIYDLKVSNSLDKITIKARAEKANNIIRINNVKVDKNNKYKQTINLNEEVNKVEVEVEDINNSKNITTYTIYITKGYITPADDLNEETNANEVFLDNITINNEEFGFKKRTYTYDIKVDEDKEEFYLNIEPEYDTDIVKINGRKRTKDQNFSAVLGLRSVGKYPITVIVEDAETNRRGTYTLNLYKGIDIPTKERPDDDNKMEPIKADQWEKVNGRWRYNDSAGRPLRGVWFFDNYYGSYFYLDNDGYMVTGWLYYDGIWYYLDEHGAMKTGWLQNNKKWYYFNPDGTMKTGWMKVEDEWYYFAEDGSMKESDWVLSNNKWYYFKRTGEMLHGGFLNSKGKYYYLNDDGSMQVDTKVINGYLFDFNKDGSIILSE